MAEHGLKGPVLGLSWDGTGYGLDGTVWGGEVLRGGYRRCERAAHLRAVPLPGGDRAAVEPPRMAVSLLVDADLGAALPALLPGFPEAHRVAEICRVRAVAPLTSSAGRLFDGVAALLGVAPEVQDYEGEAAARLEAAADPRCSDAYPLPLRGTELDTRELVRALVDDRAALPIRAARFHNGLADGLAAAALATGLRRVALGGGSMVNRLLLGRLLARFAEARVDVLLPRDLPPGDGGLSAGQAACGLCLLEGGS
jgi:hydrogenase maturation protein HypF